MISNVDALEILRLHSVEEWPIVAIARHFCCHHSVVRRGIGNSVSARADRKSILAPYFGFILETLEKYPEIHSTRIFAMLKERGFKGRSSGLVRYHLKKLRPPKQREAFFRLSSLPGEQAQVDWAHFGEFKVDQRATRKLYAFVMTLSHSRMIFLRFFLSSTSRDFYQGFREAFEFFGGVPRKIWMDNLKSGVTARVGPLIQYSDGMFSIASSFQRSYSERESSFCSKRMHTPMDERPAFARGANGLEQQIFDQQAQNKTGQFQRLLLGIKISNSYRMCIAGTSCLYERHKPEETRLYKVVSENWLSFQRAREQEGRTVPKFVVKEFEGYLRCGILAHGFARLHCGQCKVDRLVAFSCKGRGWCPSCGARRMAEVAAHLVDSRIPLVPTRQFVVTFPVQLRLWLAKSKPLAAWVCAKVAQCLQVHLRSESGIQEGKTGFVSFVQRFGSAANLNVHLHIIALDGCYEEKSTGRLKFYPSAAPREDSLLKLIQEISQKINNHLLKKGYLEVVDDTPVVGVTDSLFDSTEDLHLPAQAASVAHKIAFGERAGHPVRRLRSETSLWPSESHYEFNSDGCVSLGGYSVHAATAVRADERERLEKLVRYMARPAIADERICLVSQTELRLRLKTPWKDGTHSLQLSPMELIEKLVALVPPRGFHLTRYFGVLAPGSKHRANLPDMPADPAAAEEQSSKPLGKGKQGFKGRKRMSWAALLKRTFQIDVFQCFNCGGRMRLVEVVESAVVIAQTLTALGLSPRAPPIAPPRETKDLFQRPEDAFSEFGI